MAARVDGADRVAGNGGGFFLALWDAGLLRHYPKKKEKTFFFFFVVIPGNLIFGKRVMLGGQNLEYRKRGGGGSVSICRGPGAGESHICGVKALTGRASCERRAAALPGPPGQGSSANALPLVHASDRPSIDALVNLCSNTSQMRVYRNRCRFSVD